MTDFGQMTLHKFMWKHIVCYLALIIIIIVLWGVVAYIHDTLYSDQMELWRHKLTSLQSEIYAIFPDGHSEKL